MLLTHFGKNFVRENFLERLLDFNGILTKTADFDKKVVKFIFYIDVSSFTANRPPQGVERTFKVFDVKD